MDVEIENQCRGIPVQASWRKLIDARVQVIWQTGKNYFIACKDRVSAYNTSRMRIHDFIREMDLAYAAADVVVSRSGALAVSELCIARKPCILVPSPNVAEDHQRKNAEALTAKGAAVMVPDKEAVDKLVDEALKLMFDERRAEELSRNIAKLARPNATSDIVDEIEKLVRGPIPQTTN
jgi:UDP-N-acetylglucosamine--N-acetylmuramyl-(pentapeptide) pyrophosphoryl-undecaprenol N-acetylglucosamine transferase